MMKKNSFTLVAGLCLTLLAGCQTITSNEIFAPAGNADKNLRASVLSAFMNNPDLAAAPIHVETQKGVVLLTGYVKTIRQSDTADFIAGKVPGVKSVQNGLIVRK